MREPLIHSHITDKLPEGHPLKWETVACKSCFRTLCCVDECMQTWVEAGTGNYCTGCFAKHDLGYLEDKDGLPEEGTC